MTPARILVALLAVAALLGLAYLPQILVAKPGAQSSAPQTANRAEIEAVVRDYLLSNPGILRDMAAKLQEKDRASADAQRAGVFETERAAIYDAPRQVVLGNPQGDVTLVEFFDYNCGYCRKALDDMDALMKADPKLKIVLKEFPVLSEDSRDAARVALAVNAQAPQKYLEFHRELLTSNAAADGQAAIDVARRLGLDLNRLSADLADPNTDVALQEVHQLAQKLGIEGTPTYILGDAVIPGAIGTEALAEAIANVRSCGKAECS